MAILGAALVETCDFDYRTRAIIYKILIKNNKYKFLYEFLVFAAQVSKVFPPFGRGRNGFLSFDAKKPLRDDGLLQSALAIFLSNFYPKKGRAAPWIMPKPNSFAIRVRDASGGDIFEQMKLKIRGIRPASVDADAVWGRSLANV